MRKAKVIYKGEQAGLLTQWDDGSFTFEYDPLWMNDIDKPSISPSLPKSQRLYHSDFLFPFFYHMLPEGSNKQAVSQLNRIDLQDDFGLLLTTARNDTIGAVRVLKIEDE